MKNRKHIFAIAVFILCFALMIPVQAKAQSKKAVKKVTQQVVYKSSVSKYRYVFRGYDKNGQLVWSRRSSWMPATELAPSRGTSRAIVKNGLVYFVQNGRLYALSKSTGKVKWKTKADSVSTLTDYCFDSSGNIYICGFYGPDLVKINKKGKVLWSVDSYSTSLYWAYDVKIAGKRILLTYDTGKKTTIKINMSNGRRV